MASTANGIDSIIVISKQAAEGSKAAAIGGQVYPRVTATFDTEADKYASAEIDASQQQGDTRLGNFRTSGALKAEAACGTYAPLMAALLRRNFTAGGVAEAQTTIAAVAGGLVRSTGSWLADGMRAGTVVRIAGMAAPAAANNGKNFFVTSVTATQLNGQFMDGSAMVAKAAGDSVSVSTVGKRSYTQLAGHTNDWFTVEVQDAQIGVHRSFVDQQVSKMDLAVQPNGIATLDFTLIGKAEGPTTAAPHFAAPAAAANSGKFSGATAMLSVNGIPSQICTGMSVSLDGQVKVDAVIGSKYASAASRGKVLGSGQFTVLLQDATYLDYFKNEADVALAYAMASGTTPQADVLALAMGRIKITSAKIDDGEKNKIVTCAFDILRYQGVDAQHEATTLSIQDSAL